jgi:hypothetical protein
MQKITKLLIIIIIITILSKYTINMCILCYNQFIPILHIFNKKLVQMNSNNSVNSRFWILSQKHLISSKYNSLIFLNLT